MAYVLTSQLPDITAQLSHNESYSISWPEVSDVEHSASPLEEIYDTIGVAGLEKIEWTSEVDCLGSHTGLALANYIVNTFVTINNDRLVVKYEYSSYANVSNGKLDFAALDEVTAITDAMYAMGFNEINVDTLFAIITAYYFILMPSDVSRPVYLQSLSEICNRWINRAVNRHLLRHPSNSDMDENFAGLLIDNLQNILDIDTDSDPDTLVASGALLDKWYTGSYRFSAGSTPLADAISYLRSSLIDQLATLRSGAKIEASRSMSTEASRLSTLTWMQYPAYTFKTGDINYIVRFKDASAINSESITNVTIDKAFLTGVTSVEVNTSSEDTSEEATSSSYSIISTYADSGSITSFNTAAPIEEVMVNVFNDNVVGEYVDKRIDAGIQLTLASLAPSVKPFPTAFVIGATGSGPHAKLNAGTLTTFDTNGFTSTLVEREGSERQYSRNEALLDDDYFKWLSENDLWTVSANGDLNSTKPIIAVSYNEDVPAGNLKRTFNHTGKSAFVKGRVEYNDGTYSLTKNGFIATYFDRLYDQIDDTLLLFRQHSNDLWRRMGFGSHVAEQVPSNYIIATSHYTEVCYSGSLTVGYPGVLQQGVVIGSRLQQLLSDRLLSNRIPLISSPALLIPNEIVCYATANKDIERTINGSNRIAHIYSVEREVVSSNDSTSVIRFGDSMRLTVPSTGLYVYLSNDEHPYALANGRYALTITYVK